MQPTKRGISTWPAAALVVSNMIGTGVFMSLGFQVSGFSHADGTTALTGSVFPIVMLWVVGGVLALCGALCYAELATALPRSGGEYNFLSRIYHPVVGFCTGLCSATIGFAAPTAASAIIFGKYFCLVFPSLLLVSPHAEKIVSFGLVMVVLLFHLRSLRLTGFFQATITAITVLLIGTFVVCGFHSNPTPGMTFIPKTSDWLLLVSPAFFSSLIYVMYSYSGWNAAAYIVEEVANPSKALPRALILGTAFVMMLYVAVNCVFLYASPLTDLARQPEVAHIAGVAIFGQSGARFTSALICIGLIANVSAMLWVGSRVCQAMGDTYPALGVLGRTTNGRVPYIAVIYQFMVVLGLLFFNAADIINYVESVLLFWSLLAVLGVIVLRWREPNLARPYRTWGYPLPPIIFGIVTFCCLVQTSLRYPHESEIGALTVLIGIPIYFWVRRVPVEQMPENGATESSS